MPPRSATKAALTEVRRRLLEGHRVASETLRQHRANNSVRNADYTDGRVRTFEQAIATVEQVWAEIVEHAGGDADSHPLTADES